MYAPHRIPGGTRGALSCCLRHAGARLLDSAVANLLQNGLADEALFRSTWRAGGRSTVSRLPQTGFRLSSAW